MTLLIWIAVLAVAVAVLVKASDFFVDGASGVGKAIGMPPFVIGVIIVGIGRSVIHPQDPLSSCVFPPVTLTAISVNIHPVGRDSQEDTLSDHPRVVIEVFCMIS